MMMEKALFVRNAAFNVYYALVMLVIVRNV